MENVKLHRCSFTFLKTKGHGCHQVQMALEEQGVPYELVKTSAIPRSRRKELKRVTGQVMLPAIEFADGSGYRAESAEMAAEIRAGRLFEHRGAPAAG
jgi:glutathione S-transferase